MSVLAYLLSPTNKFLTTSTFGTPNVDNFPRGIFDGIPLGDTTQDGLGEMGVKVILIAGTTPIGIEGEITDNAGPYADPFIALPSGGKAVTTSTYAPAYTANDGVVQAYDKATGALLVQPPKGASTATANNVNYNAASVTLLAANAARKGATIYNGTDKVLHLSFQGTATVDNSVQDLSPEVTSLNGGYYEVPFGYTGIITGIWEAAGAGKANITEITQ